MNAKMKGRELHKYYLCILIGALVSPKGTLEGYLFKDEKKNRVYVRRQPCPGAKRSAHATGRSDIATVYRLLR